MAKQEIPILALGLVAGVVFLLKGKKKSIKKNVVESPVSPKLPTSGAFPLRFGSRGNLVKELQRALLKLGGRTAQYISTTGGADGIFGNGTRRAILSAGYPEVITQALYQKILKGTSGQDTFATAKTYLFVDTTFFDTSLYMNISSNGNGHTPEFPFLTLPDKTYLGNPTGQVRGKYIEVRLKLNNAEAKFWVDRNDTETFTGNAMDFDSFRRKRKRMTAAHINRIVNAFS